MFILANYIYCQKMKSNLQGLSKWNLLFTKSISASPSSFLSCSNSSGNPPGQNGQLVELPLIASLGGPGARRRDMEFFAVWPISSKGTSRNWRSFPVVGSRSTYNCKYFNVRLRFLHRCEYRWWWCCVMQHFGYMPLFWRNILPTSLWLKTTIQALQTIQAKTSNSNLNCIKC